MMGTVPGSAVSMVVDKNTHGPCPHRASGP